MGVAAAGQLRRKVSGRAGDEADLGELLVTVPAGDAEVADLGATGLVDQHVAGFDVAVDDAALVGAGEGPGQLGADVGDPLRRELPVVRDLVGEGLALDILHDQPGPTVMVDHVVDGDRVGVVERGGRAGLAHGALGLGGRLAGQRADLLDRDLAAEDLVTAQPHGAHAAPPDGAQHLVAAGYELGLHEVLSYFCSVHPTAKRIPPTVRTGRSGLQAGWY